MDTGNKSALGRIWKYGKYPALFILFLVLAVLTYRGAMKRGLVGDDYYLLDAGIGDSHGPFPLSLFNLMSPLYVRPLPLLLWHFQYQMFGVWAPP